MSEARQRVVVLGASDNPQRYSHLALKSLREHGHEVIPVHPRLDAIEGIAVRHDLSEITAPIDTVTVYVAAPVSSQLRDKLLQLRPARVIFNPGAENPELKQALEAHGIATEEACTLVLLRTGQF